MQPELLGLQVVYFPLSFHQSEPGLIDLVGSGILAGIIAGSIRVLVGSFKGISHPLKPLQIYIGGDRDSKKPAEYKIFTLIYFLILGGVGAALWYLGRAIATMFPELLTNSSIVPTVVTGILLFILLGVYHVLLSPYLGFKRRELSETSYRQRWVAVLAVLIPFTVSIFPLYQAFGYLQMSGYYFQQMINDHPLSVLPMTLVIIAVGGRLWMPRSQAFSKDQTEQIDQAPGSEKSSTSGQKEEIIQQPDSQRALQHDDVSAVVDTLCREGYADSEYILSLTAEERISKAREFVEEHFTNKTTNGVEATDNISEGSTQCSQVRKEINTIVHQHYHGYQSTPTREALETISGCIAGKKSVDELEPAIAELIDHNKRCNKINDSLKTYHETTRPSDGGTDDIKLNNIQRALNKMDRALSGTADDTLASKLLTLIQDYEKVTKKRNSPKNGSDDQNIYKKRIRHATKQLCSNINFQWISERSDQQFKNSQTADDFDNEIDIIKSITAAFENGLIGEQVVNDTADSLLTQQSLAKGTTSYQLLETITTAQPSTAGQVEEVLDQAVDELNSYGVLYSQIDTNIDQSDLNQKRERLAQQLEMLEIPQLQEVLDKHIENRIEAVEIAQDEITPYVIKKHMEYLVSIVEQIETSDKSDFRDIESAKKQVLQARNQSKSISGGHEITNHFLSLAEEFESEAKEAKSLNNQEAAEAYADATIQLLENIEQLYYGELRRKLELI